MWMRGIPGVVLVLLGAVWIGQGTGAIHGSSMTGQGKYAGIGAACVVAGLALLAWAWAFARKRRRLHQSLSDR